MPVDNDFISRLTPIVHSELCQLLWSIADQKRAVELDEIALEEDIMAELLFENRKSQGAWA